jgi:hypothetical protein
MNESIFICTMKFNLIHVSLYLKRFQKDFLPKTKYSRLRFRLKE